VHSAGGLSQLTLVLLATDRLQGELVISSSDTLKFHSSLQCKGMVLKFAVACGSTCVSSPTSSLLPTFLSRGLPYPLTASVEGIIVPDHTQG